MANDSIDAKGLLRDANSMDSVGGIGVGKEYSTS